MEITTEMIKALRDETSVSVMQCKKALEEAGGDMDKAKIILRKQSASAATKKSDRALGAGIASAYTHAGGSVVGAVVLACETDFVARNEEFGKLAYTIAMHVAAMDPVWTTREEVTEEDMKSAREVFEKQVAELPAASQQKALEGKLESFVNERILLNQPFVKDTTITVREMIDQAIQKFGEKIAVVRFERLSAK